MKVLKARKFGLKMDRLDYKVCLQGGKSHILVNGCPGRMICSKRGLRGILSLHYYLF